MPIDRTSTRNIERLHALTRHGDVALAGFYGEETLAWLRQCIARELPEAAPLEIGTPARMVAVLRELRRSKQAWSQVYGEIAADLAQDPAGFDAGRLHDFIAGCPWKFLRDSAADALQEREAGSDESAW